MSLGFWAMVLVASQAIDVPIPSEFPGLFGCIGQGLCALFWPLPVQVLSDKRSTMVGPNFILQ